MESSIPNTHHQPQRRHVLCVTTNKPSTAASMAGGGGALTMVCPYTGSISASLAISGDLSSTTQAVSSNSHQQQQQQQLGISSLSLYSPRVSHTLHPTQAPLALAYGGKATSRGSNNDCAAMLVSLISHNPKVHWKARLPEAQLTAGIVLSECGHYAIGGGASGTLYVWSTLQGHLLKTIHRAHYRAITCLHTTGDQRHVLTGGADGMVHLFAWMDLVESSSSSSSGNRNNNKQKTVVPIRTWSQHSVPITCLGSLSDYRMISASQDGLVHVFETFSEAIVATIQLPQGASSLAVRDQRVWVGGALGTLYCLDLDLYAMHQTIQLGASIGHHHHGGLRQQQQQQQQTKSRKGQDSGSSPSYKTTLKGHQHPVTSLALWADDQGQEFLVSGDASGTLRVWDLGARVCVRIVRPWSNTATDGPVTATTKTKSGDPKKKKQVAAPQQQPISSIQVMEVADGTSGANNNPMAMNTMTTATSKAKGGASAWVSRLPQLQKYAPSHGMDPDGESAAQTQWTPVPLWNAQPRDDAFWDMSKADYGVGRKRPRLGKVAPNRSSGNADSSATAGDASKDDELQQLRKQLEDANSTIARWETVNNQLMAKLNKN